MTEGDIAFGALVPAAPQARPCHPTPSTSTRTHGGCGLWVLVGGGEQCRMCHGLPSGGGAPCQPWCMFASARLLCLCPLCAQVCCPPSWFTPMCEPGGSCCAPARPLPQAGEVTTGQRRSMGGQQEGEATSGLAGAPGGQGSVPGWTAGPSTAYIGHLAFSFHETCKGRSTLIQNPLMQLPVREAAKGDLRS